MLDYASRACNHVFSVQLSSPTILPPPRHIPAGQEPPIPSADAPPKPKIPRAPLSSAQRRRREDNRYRAAERQRLYPQDPDNPRARILRQSPRTLFPKVPDTRSVRVVLEHIEHPNEFLYLLQSLTADTAVYAFYLPDGTVWRKKNFPSVYAACLAAAHAGYLDASW